MSDSTPICKAPRSPRSLARDRPAKAAIVPPYHRYRTPSVLSRFYRRPTRRSSGGVLARRRRRLALEAERGHDEVQMGRNPYPRSGLPAKHEDPEGDDLVGLVSLLVSFPPIPSIKGRTP